MAQCLKERDYKALLLLCSRIRNYNIYFNYISETLLNINLKLFKDCECFDKNLLKEEFIEAIINFSNRVVTIPYLKFLIETPHLLNDKYYL